LDIERKTSADSKRNVLDWQISRPRTNKYFDETDDAPLAEIFAGFPGLLLCSGARQDLI